MMRLRLLRQKRFFENAQDCVLTAEGWNGNSRVFKDFVASLHLHGKQHSDSEGPLSFGEVREEARKIFRELKWSRFSGQLSG